MLLVSTVPQSVLQTRSHVHTHLCSVVLAYFLVCKCACKQLGDSQVHYTSMTSPDCLSTQASLAFATGLLHNTFQRECVCALCIPCERRSATPAVLVHQLRTAT